MVLCLYYSYFSINFLMVNKETITIIKFVVNVYLHLHYYKILFVKEKYMDYQAVVTWTQQLWRTSHVLEWKNALQIRISRLQSYTINTI